MLMMCPALTHARKELLDKSDKNKNIQEQTKILIRSYFHDGKDSVQLILDGSVLPEVIRTRQKMEHKFYMKFLAFPDPGATLSILKYDTTTPSSHSSMSTRV